MTTDVQADEQDLDTTAKAFGVSVDWLKQLPKHEADCSLVTTHHLTCTCGAYGRRAGLLNGQ